MGRTKTFDKEQALEKAMWLFWDKGYEETSLNELLDAMGILNGSFYNTFGDKKTLFKEVMAHYGKKTAFRAKVLRESKTASEAIRGFFKDFYGKQKSKELPLGCLIAKNHMRTVTDPELNEYMGEGLKLTAKLFQKKIQDSIDNGDLKTEHSAKDLAQLVFSHLQGVMKVTDLSIPLSTLERQTGIFLDSLGL